MTITISFAALMENLSVFFQQSRLPRPKPTAHVMVTEFKIPKVKADSGKNHECPCILFHLATAVIVKSECKAAIHCFKGLRSMQ